MVSSRFRNGGLGAKGLGAKGLAGSFLASWLFEKQLRCRRTPHAAQMSPMLPLLPLAAALAVWLTPPSAHSLEMPERTGARERGRVKNDLTDGAGRIRTSNDEVVRSVCAAPAVLPPASPAWQRGWICLDRRSRGI